MLDLYEKLKQAEQKKKLPGIIAYNRIDGPGSSLDLREFQQSIWNIPQIPKDIFSDPSVEWTRKLPRTVGVTINIGTKIEVRPFKPNQIEVKSIEYNTVVSGNQGEITPKKENWLLKVLDIFGISGASFILQNTHEKIQSSGLGGSATAMSGVCILANELAGRPFSGTQLVSMASRMEQDFGVSITGTQEQSNVVYGGAKDYVWFPWGIPGRPESGYGESMRFELFQPENYKELEQRMAIFHTNLPRKSTDVNTVWRNALSTSEGYELHMKKPELAYQFREGLRLRDWEKVFNSITKYREIRTILCSAYMDEANEMQRKAEMKKCTVFPLGAGGGGGVFIFAMEPESLKELRNDFKDIYREIPFKIKSKGHEFINLPL